MIQNIALIAAHIALQSALSFKVGHPVEGSTPRRRSAEGRGCMLCFVMALKSKQVSRDWVKVCKLFEASLQSAYGQTQGDFRIVVVCHETPTVTARYDKRLEFINVDIPPPTRISTSLCMEDKWLKLTYGMIRAGELKPDFVMIMDADDLVSRHLADFTARHRDRNGWMVCIGYRYRLGSRLIRYDNQFRCGTDSIVSSRLIKFPDPRLASARWNMRSSAGEKLPPSAGTWPWRCSSAYSAIVAAWNGRRPVSASKATTASA